METLREYATKRMQKYTGTVSHSDMIHFLNSKGSYGEGLKLMLEGMQIYCDAYKKEQGDSIGDDGYMGAQCENILKALHYLLSGLGRFDGGTLSSFINDLADDNKLDIE